MNSYDNLRRGLVAASCGPLEFYQETLAAVDAMIGWLTMKFSFVSHFPWLLWRVKTREGAKLCLETYDRLMKDPGSAG